VIINDRGRAIVKEAEGLSLSAYRCPAGVLTIGYGHTEGVRERDRITLHQAEVLLEYDLSEAEAAVTKLAPKATGPQFSACVSLAFNIGIGRFEKSTLLKELNAGRIQNAAAEFMKWTHAAGKVMPGLVKRRAAERALFLEVPS